MTDDRRLIEDYLPIVDKRVLVYSLQSRKRESLDHINLLQTIDHLAARQDQRREPVEGNEARRVIQRCVLGKMPPESDSTPAATGYQEAETVMSPSPSRRTTPPASTRASSTTVSWNRCARQT